MSKAIENLNEVSTDNNTEVEEFEYECVKCGCKVSLDQAVLAEDCNLECPECGGELKELFEVEVLD